MWNLSHCLREMYLYFSHGRKALYTRISCVERKFQHRPACLPACLVPTPTTHKVSLYACVCALGVVTFQGFRFFRESTRKNQWFQRPMLATHSVRSKLPSWQVAVWKFLKKRNRESAFPCRHKWLHFHLPPNRLWVSNYSYSYSWFQAKLCLYEIWFAWFPICVCFMHPDNFKTMPIYVYVHTYKVCMYIHL